MQYTKSFPAIAVILALLLSPVWAIGEDTETKTTPPPAKEVASEGEAVPAGQTAPGQTAPQSSYGGGYLSLGAEYSNQEGAMERASEFKPANQGTNPIGRLGLWGFRNGLAYDLSARRGVDPTDQDYRLGIDLRRIWKSSVSFSKMPHRLINDPLTNLDAGKGGPVVRHTSNDLGVRYCPVYQDMRWSNRVTLPSLPLLSVHFNYRNQARKGSYQARVGSHCSTCHIVSNSREMDRETEEFVGGVEFGNNTAKVEYEYLTRELFEHAGTPVFQPDKVEHPVTQQRAFTNRASFDSSDGLQPYNLIPEFRKIRHLVRGRLQSSTKGQLVATYIKDCSDNNSLGYGTETQIAGGQYSNRFGKNLRINLKLRNQDTESDSFFVDINEPKADFGPQLGKTYGEAYPGFGSADFIQTSTLERDVLNFKADAVWTLLPKTNLRGSYEFEEIERPRQESEKTKINRLRIGLSSGLWDVAKFHFRYVFADATDPYVHMHAALPPGLQPYPAPGASPLLGLQYYALYAARQHSLSNSFKEAHDIWSSATFSPGQRLGVTLSARYKRHSNDQINSLYQYSDDQAATSVEVWYAPTNRVDLMANYSFQNRKTVSLFGIAAYDG